jgi:drug/metabolite transporter (DMT)-like permease
MTGNQRGIVAIVGCMTAYTGNDVLVKQILLQHYPVGETIFLRGMISALLIGGFVVALGHAPQMRAAMSRLLAARSVCDGLSTVCFIAALAQMPLANIAAVLQIGPLLITVLSVLFYREVVGWRRWTAIGVGFFGALLVIKPLPSAFDIWAVIGAGSALFAALREMQNRSIDRAVPTLVIAFWGAVGITAFGTLFAFSEDWRLFELGDLIRLFVASMFVGIAIYLMALAFRDVDLSVVAPFRYSYLITSAIAGLLVFGEWPDGWTVAGAALIVASGIYLLHREALRRRQLTAKITPAL